jgi:hypothetical protein
MEGRTAANILISIVEDPVLARYSRPSQKMIENRISTVKREKRAEFHVETIQQLKCFIEKHQVIS